jgi:mannosyltransferase OCH1-like enzyme
MENQIENRSELFPLVSHFPNGVKQDIPRLLHLIWVGDALQPAYVDLHLNEWRQLMPDWTVRLWTNADITENNFDLPYLNLINSAEKGAQKADIMRYLIVFKYGGVYMDTDIKPHRSLDPLVTLGRSFIICHDIYITWAYVACAFFAAPAEHPILEYAARLCLSATLNTNDVHLQTGPRIFGEAIAMADYLEPCVLLHHQYLYRNIIGDQGVDGKPITENTLQRFGNHFYAHDW